MDKSLIDAIQLMSEGKEEGFNKVYSETYNHVYFRAKSYMKNEEDTLDLVQIVYVEAYRNIGLLQTPEALFGWLDGITYRQGMKQYRKKKEVLLSEEGEGVFETLETEDISSMPELTADQKETSKIIRELIEELPVLQKIAMIAYYFDNLSVGQIAEIQECSEGTVKSRLNYGRKYLKDRIEEKEKKEGYRLHVFALPTLYFAIKMLAEETTMTVQAAQGVYNASCVATGLTAGTITASTVASSGIAGSTQAVAAAEAGKAGGIGAKFASLGAKTKALIVAGTVATAGIGGTAYMVTTNQPAVESTQPLSYYVSVTAEDENYNAPPLHPVQTGENEYTYYYKDLSEYIGYGDFLVFQVKEDIPDSVKVVYVRYGDGLDNMVTVEWKDNSEPLYMQYEENGCVIVTIETE